MPQLTLLTFSLLGDRAVYLWVLWAVVALEYKVMQRRRELLSKHTKSNSRNRQGTVAINLNIRVSVVNALLDLK